MRPSAAIITIYRAIFFLFVCSAFFAKPLFAQATPLVAGKEGADTSAPRQCSEESGESEKDLLCFYSPLEKRCREKQQEKESVPPTVITIPGMADDSVPIVREQQEIQEKPKSIPTPVPKSVPVKRPAAIHVPMPYIYKTENGRKVCATKNDHPRKSKKGKGTHMDMECCLDPDEYPNPHCYYPPEKYEKLLKKKH